MFALAIACVPAERPGPAGPTVGGLMADAEGGNAPVWSAWSAPVNLGPVVNSPYNDNSPAISKDGLSLYISSSILPLPPGPRPGGLGGPDIWVSQRASIHAPWGEPADLGSNIHA